MLARHLIRQLTPPPVRRSLKQVFLLPPLYRRFKHKIEYEYLSQGWRMEELDPAIKGWNDQSILEVYKAKWPAFMRWLEGSGPLGIAHETGLTDNEDLIAHNVMMIYSFGLLTAAHKRDSISMLDWGGGIGHYLALSQAIVPTLTIDYACKDVPVLATYGAQLFPKARFFTDDTCLDQTYDFVLASSSFQYAEDWPALLGKLARATSGHLMITRLPTVQRVPSFVFVQRPYSTGYHTEYLGWAINRGELLHHAKQAGLTLMREFVTGEAPFVARAPEQNYYRGFLFQKQA